MAAAFRCYIAHRIDAIPARRVAAFPLAGSKRLCVVVSWFR
jgi:hypothetical protein